MPSVLSILQDGYQVCTQFLTWNEQHVPAAQDVFSYENLAHPLKLSLIYAGCYGLLHLVSRQLIHRALGKNRLAMLSNVEKVYLVEKVCSSVNSLVTGFAGLRAILPFLFGQQMRYVHTFGIFQYYPASLTHILSSYVGYSIYDMAVMLFQTFYDEDLIMWAHHFVGLMGAFLMMLFRRASYFPVAFLISEITVFPTNIVWYIKTLQKCGYRFKPLIQHQAYNLRNVSFLAFRTFLAPVCLYYAWTQIDSAIDLKNAFNSGFSQLGFDAKVKIILNQVRELPLVVSVGTVFNMATLGWMNFYWTMMALKSALKSQKKTGGPPAKSNYMETISGGLKDE
ncbi:hypothetical protein MP228_005261 [Amoeboaphelidium protococcarum]|nr:hypothetical protein MP228_005261 [Amoeboaphelidium protococcarum]